MAGIMSLGDQVVTPSIQMGEEKVYNVDGYDWLGEINAQGELVTPTKDINLVFDGVKELGSSILSSKFSSDTRIKSVSFPDLETVTGSGACGRAFYSCDITSVSMPKLKSISASNSFSMCFRRNKITNFYLPELETITGDYAFSNCLSNNSYLKTASFPKLVSCSNNAFNGFAYPSTLEEASFPLLRTAGGNCFNLAFCNSNLNTANFNSLETAGNYCFSYTFFGTKVKIISFPSLSTVGSNCFYEMAGDETTDIYFNSLNSNSFGGNTNCFEDMLYGLNGVTVHFPIGLDATIGNWSDVLAGFGGTNTTVLYDL